MCIRVFTVCVGGFEGIRPYERAQNKAVAVLLEPCSHGENHIEWCIPRFNNSSTGKVHSAGCCRNHVLTDITSRVSSVTRAKAHL